jgi:enamine deaminase RidA (YjgF/YER057c/UK114 family)
MTSRRRVFSGSPFEDKVGFCRAVAVGDRIFVAGTAPIWPDGSVDESPSVQAKRCLEIIGGALAELGSGLHDVVRTRVYVVDPADFPEIGAVHGEVFADVRPANTTVVAGGLLDPRWKVEIEAEAVTS